MTFGNHWSPRAQKIIEDIENDVSNILNREILEHMRSMFFHDIPDSLDG
jgi:hypothetical protein